MIAMKRFMLMVLVSLAIFFFFASIDEYENLVAPFLRKSGGEEDRSLRQDPLAVKAFLEEFNGLIYQAYLETDPFIIDRLPADEALKGSIREDMKFLMRTGKVMKVRIEDLTIDGVERIPPAGLAVKTTEKVALSYLNFRDRSIVMPEKRAMYSMFYTIDERDGHWIVMRSETVGVEGLD